VREETASDYKIGFARLADPEDEALPIAFERVYGFDVDSRYRAITRGSEQVDLINEYEKQPGIPVHYHFYNPWEVPMEQRITLSDPTPPAGAPEIGVRVIPSAVLHSLLPGASANHPSLADLATPGPVPAVSADERSVPSPSRGRSRD
jgi:hypothetical protein